MQHSNIDLFLLSTITLGTFLFYQDGLADIDSTSLVHVLAN